MNLNKKNLVELNVAEMINVNAGRRPRIETGTPITRAVAQAVVTFFVDVIDKTGNDAYYS